MIRNKIKCQLILKSVLEGDSKLIINSIKAGGKSIASVEPLIINSLKAGGQSIASVEPLFQDVIFFFFFFSNCYSKFLYSHCWREDNRVAYSLARYSINVSNYVVWMEWVPNLLFTIIQQDVANLAN